MSTSPPSLAAFAVQFRVGQPEPGDGPVAGADDEQLGAPVPAGMAGAVAVPGISEHAGAPSGDHGRAAGVGGGIHQPPPPRRSSGLILHPPPSTLPHRPPSPLPPHS